MHNVLESTVIDSGGQIVAFSNAVLPAMVRGRPAGHDVAFLTILDGRSSAVDLLGNRLRPPPPGQGFVTRILAEFLTTPAAVLQLTEGKPPQRLGYLADPAPFPV